MSEEIGEHIARLRSAAIARDTVDRRAVWEALKANAPELADILPALSATFGIDAININGKSWSRNEFGRLELKKMGTLR